MTSDERKVKEASSPRQRVVEGNASLDLGLQAGWRVWYSSFLLKTAYRCKRAAWVGILVGVLGAWIANHALAQDTNWGPKWDPGIRDKWFKDDQTDPKKPTHRLAPVCKDCQGLADQLQNALDDWYLLQYADGEAIRKDGLKKQDGDLQKAGNECKDNAMAGLGQPSAKELKAKQDKQKKNAKDDPKKFGDKKALAAEIERLKKLLDDCLVDCNKPKEITPTPTPTPIEETNEIPNPPAFEIQIPPLPPCFDSGRDRQKHRQKLEELQPKLGFLKKQYGAEYLTPPANDAWKEWGDKLKKAIDDVSDQLSKVDTVPVPCPTPTPTPIPAKGGKAPTPTPTKGKPKRAPRVATGGNISLPQETFCELIADNKIDIDVTGTGETIGHVADARVTNFTDEVIAFVIPPTVLESRSKKNQNYGVPHTTDVVLEPHESKKIPLDGVCLNRNKPPVGKDVGGDLAFNDCDPDRRISRDDSDRMLRISESVYEAADELEDDGQLKEIPYKDPEKRKDIVKQWATWVRMSEITGDPPPTKDDLRKVVEKQAGKVPPDQQKKIDQGIDTIFEKIELTTEKAKDLEKENENEASEAVSPGANTFEISDNTPTPQPGTQEKKKKKKEKKEKEKYPPPIQAWLDAFHAELAAESKMIEKRIEYKDALRKWGGEHNQHYKELKDALEKAKQKIGDAYKNGMPTKQDVEDRIKAQSELDKLEQEVAKDFQKTGSGKAYFQEFADAEDALKRAKAAADEAGKNIEQEVKNAILNKEEDEILKKKD